MRPDQLKAGLEFYTYDELTTAMKGVVDKQKLSDQEKNDAFLTAKKRGVPAIQQTPAGPEHDGYECNGCGMTPITGDRYSCRTCVDFDLCSACEAKTNHPTDHPLSKLRAVVATENCIFCKEQLESNILESHQGKCGTCPFQGCDKSPFQNPRSLSAHKAQCRCNPKIKDKQKDQKEGKRKSLKSMVDKGGVFLGFTNNGLVKLLRLAATLPPEVSPIIYEGKGTKAIAVSRSNARQPRVAPLIASPYQTKQRRGAVYPLSET